MLRFVSAFRSRERLTASPQAVASQAAARWQWPRAPVCFIPDVHADVAALRASLALAGLVDSSSADAPLTRLGQNSTLILGGDCVNKGPENLAVLLQCQRWQAAGLDLQCLLGNHELALLSALMVTGPLRAERALTHLFVKHANKLLVLLMEILAWGRQFEYEPLIPERAVCRSQLLPAADWAEYFANAMSTRLPLGEIAAEIDRIQRKAQRFELTCLRQGIELQDVWAALWHARRLFLHADGDCRWFFDQMQLADQRGSFLFVHAGVDDQLAQQLAARGVDVLNQRYQPALGAGLLALNYGDLAPLVSTRYRSRDPAFTAHGAEQLQLAGIRAIVHGHQVQTSGQQVTLRHGILNVEADVCLNRRTRASKGLEGIGAGATLILPQGCIRGVSSDFPGHKEFRPDV